jgi:hypothetical protein
MNAKRYQTEFDVRSYGALGDGETYDTRAIQKAIDACAQGGGGRVLLHHGTFLSGTIHLRSHVTLYLSPTAVLLGGPRIEDYDQDTQHVYHQLLGWALIYAADAEHTGVEGPGEVRCSGEVFERKRRPVVMRFEGCRDLRLRDFALHDYPSWGIHLINCRNVFIDGVTINCAVQHNNDGIDVDGCENVFISNCHIVSGDDSIALKTVEPDSPCRNIVVTNCVLSSNCAAIRIGPESVDNFEQITVSNCVIRDTALGGIKLQMNHGAVMQDILFSNIVMENVSGPISLRLAGWKRTEHFEWSLLDDSRWAEGRLRNIRFENIRARVPQLQQQGTPLEDSRGLGERFFCIQLTGTPQTTIENVTFSNVHVTFAGGGTAQHASRRDIPENERNYPEITMFGILPAYGLYARHVRGLRMHNVEFDVERPDLRAALFCNDVEDLELNAFRAQGHPEAQALIHLQNTRDAWITASRPTSPCAAFVHIEDSPDEALRLEANDLRYARKEHCQ